MGAFAAFGGGGTPITQNRTITVNGGFTVGTLSFNNPSFGYTLAAGTGAALTLDNGASGAFVTDTAGSHTIQAPIALTANGATFTAAGASDVLSLSGAVSGSGPLTKTGSGTVALTGPNTYSGGTSINGGTLTINSSASLGDAAGVVTFAGGGIRLLAGFADAHNFQVKDLADAVIDTNGQNLTLTGTITALTGATGGVVKNGAGTLALQGADSYVGQTTINAGTLSINSNASLGDPATGAALNLGAGTTLTATATTVLDNAGSNQRPVTVAAGGATVDLPDTIQLTISGPLTGGTVTKVGLGTLGVSNTANTTPFVVTAGTLRSEATAAGNGGFGTGAITLQGGATISSAMPAGNTLLFANALNVPTGQTGNINAPERFNWTGVPTGGGTLNVNVISTVSRHDFNSDWSGFTGNLNITGTGIARLFINGGNFGAGVQFGNATVDLGGSATIAPVTNSTGNDIRIGALSGSSATATLGGGSAGSPRYTIGGLNTSTTFAGLVAGNASIVKVGTGTLTLSNINTNTGATTVNAGTLAVSGSIATSTGVTVNNAGTFAAPVAQVVKILTVNTGGVAVVSGGAPVHALTVGDNTPSANPITIAATGAKVDLATNGLIVDYAPGNDAAVLDSVRSQVIAGYNASAPGAGDGTWNGSGITSANAAADANAKGIGYALATDILGPTGGTFLGSPADPDAVLARYTLLGDATLDGAVNFADLVQLAQNYNITDGSRTWFLGDFTYDGNTNFADLVKLAQNYNTALPTDPIPGASAGFQADLAAAFASVPEPGAFSLLMLCACGLAARRRTRTKTA